VAHSYHFLTLEHDSLVFHLAVGG